MADITPGVRTGVYVDVANITMNGGYGMKYDILREFACRGGAHPVRLNAYAAFDQERADIDPLYRGNKRRYHDVLREQGFKVIEKIVKWYTDDEGNRIGKANADIDMAVDALLQSENLDRVVLVTGDGDFVQVVRALQNRGCRVEVVAFDNVSSDLRREADMFLSGYLIPNLLPQMPPGSKRWGEIGARVRGLCYYFDHSRNFGFLRFMDHIAESLWDLDARKPGSPYKTVYFHAIDLPDSTNLEDLPSREIIFEFELSKADSYQAERRRNELRASFIELAGTRQKEFPKNES